MVSVVLFGQLRYGFHDIPILNLFVDVDQLYAKNKFTGYRVNPNVSSHFAHGK